MADRRPTLLSLDAPRTDDDRLRAQTGIAKPEPAPSLWRQFTTAAKGAAGNDDPAVEDARRRDAVDAGLAPIVSELQRRGIAAGDYTARNARDGFALSYNEDTIWQGIARARALDHEAFKGVENTPDAFRQRLTAPVEANIARDRNVQERSGWAPWLAGQFVGGAADPINQAAMLAGAGAARTIAQAALRDATINFQTELVQEPMRAIARAKRGEDATPGQLMSDLALAAGTGAVGGAVIHGLGGVAKGMAERRAARTPDGDLAEQMARAIPPENMTADESWATGMLTRVDEVAATTPFKPGAGANAHLAKMDAATSALNGTAPAAAPPPAVPRFDLRDYSLRVSRHESGGQYDAQAKGSSAYGAYQLTRPTFLRYARKANRFSVNMPDDVLWSQRTNPAMQEAVMTRLTADNRAALAKAGAPETYGNLYLMHFAGEGGGTKILRAAPDAPIESILSEGAIKANPFLKGKTAGEVIEWAHRAVKDTEHAGPILRRDQFESDGEWSTAQRALDDAEHAAELARAKMHLDEAPPGRSDDGVPGFDDVPMAPAERALGSDWEPGNGPVAGDVFPGDLPLPSEREAARAPDAAVTFETAKGSTYRMEADGTTTRDKAYRPEHGAAEQGPQPRSEATFFVTPEEASALGEFQVKGGSARSIETLPDGRIGMRHLDGPDAGKFERRTVVAPRTKPDVGLIPVELWNDGKRVHFGNEITRVEKAPAASVDARDAAGGRASPDLGADGGIAGRGARVEAEPIPQPLSGFDHPDDMAAARQIDSLSHDLRQLVESEAGRDLTVRINEEGDVISAVDALNDLDADDAALDAAWACLT